MRKLSSVLLIVFLTTILINLAGCTSHIEKFEFELNEEGTEYYLSKYNYLADDATEEVVIPASYNDLPVTRIGEGAFRSCTEITKITIPDSITRIEGGAFRFCSNLVDIGILNSVVYIGSQAFEYCSKLESVVTTSSCDIEYGAFSECTKLTKVELGTSNEGLGYIGKYVFYKCTSLESVLLGDGYCSIGDHAFNDCTELESISFTRQIANIGEQAFESCSSLKNINFKGTEDDWLSIHKYPWWDRYAGEFVINYIAE